MQTIVYEPNIYHLSNIDTFTVQTITRPFAKQTRPIYGQQNSN